MFRGFRLSYEIGFVVVVPDQVTFSRDGGHDWIVIPLGHMLGAII